jgi:molybdopterin/thiamine biosynthesis adenylyltransferase
VRAAQSFVPINPVALTNRQIERYSRQLIVKDFGGVAQERLLAARILLLGDYADTSVLAYLVGAGVGQIDLYADLDPPASDAVIARMRDLNPDSTVRTRPRVAPDRIAQDREAQDIDLGDLGEFDLALVLAGDDATINQARSVYERPDKIAANLAGTSGRNLSQNFPHIFWQKLTQNLPPNLPIVLARLDLPPRIAVIPRPPPCPRCASVGDLLAPVGVCADNAGFVASLAALEAIKLLAGFAAPPKPTLIEFRGYESSARVIDSIPGSTCACTAAQSEQKV